jgi:hypothetical protein
MYLSCTLSKLFFFFPFSLYHLRNLYLLCTLYFPLSFLFWHLLTLVVNSSCLSLSCKNVSGAYFWIRRPSNHHPSRRRVKKILDVSVKLFRKHLSVRAHWLYQLFKTDWIQTDFPSIFRCKKSEKKLSPTWWWACNL